jgi:DnaJ-class molecular chaperone
MTDSVTIDFNKVNRLEIINDTKCSACFGSGRKVVQGHNESFECLNCNGLGIIGRQVILHNDNKVIETSIQDDGRTLKVFIKERA